MDHKSKSKIKCILDYLFSEDRKLGEGSFGKVYKGQNKNTRQDVAIKSIPMTLFENGQQHLIKNLQREIEIMRDLRHENIVQLVAFTQTPNNIYLILEYCNGGDISTAMKVQQEKRFPEDIAIQYFCQICEGFKILHSKGIIHRDIKPANIMLHNGKAKISDFGFARVLDQSKLNNQQNLTLLGTPLYMSPQILTQDKFSSKCDIWSLGVMFYEMIYGRLPWYAQNQVELLKMINLQPLQFPQNIQSSYNVKDILEKMLRIKEEERISWEEIFAHPLLQDKDQYLFEKVAEQNLQHIQKFKIVGQFNSDFDYYLQFSEQLQGLQQQEVSGMDVEGGEQTQNLDFLIKIDSCILFNRNNHVIFNFLACQIHSLKMSQELHISNDLFLKISFLLLNLYLIYSKGMLNQLNDTEQFVNSFSRFFKKEELLQYKDSQLWNITINIIEQDMQLVQAHLEQIKLKLEKRYIVESQQPQISEELQLLQQLMQQEYQYIGRFYNLIMNQFILTVNCAKKMSLQDVTQDLKKKYYYILKLCFVIQSFDSYFTFDKDNINFNQYNIFYQKYEQINLDQLIVEVENDIYKMYGNP